MGNYITLCTLTLIPFKNYDYPRPTTTLSIDDYFNFNFINDFATSAPFLENNLCISYQGSQCKGIIVDVFENKNFGGDKFSATLLHNAGTVCMSKEVKTSASSICAYVPFFSLSATDVSALSVAADGVSLAADEGATPLSMGLQQLFDSGFLEQAALDRLNKEDPAVLEAALKKLQAEQPEVLEQLAASVPITLDKVNELLAL